MKEKAPAPDITFRGLFIYPRNLKQSLCLENLFSGAGLEKRSLYVKLRFLFENIRTELSGLGGRKGRFQVFLWRQIMILLGE